MQRCDVPKCHAEADLTYLGHGVCERHWNRLTADEARPDALRMALGIEAAPVTAMEEDVEPTTSISKASPKPEPEATTPKASKTAKSSKKVKAPAKLKPAKREKVENPVVFAFRLSEAERTRIHDAAGGGKASQFVLAAALAAADGDVEGFKKVIGTRATK